MIRNECKMAGGHKQATVNQYKTLTKHQHFLTTLDERYSLASKGVVCLDTFACGTKHDHFRATIFVSAPSWRGCMYAAQKMEVYIWSIVNKNCPSSHPHVSHTY